MKSVITYIDRTVEMLENNIKRYKAKGPDHPIKGMTEWYADRAKTTANEIDELRFIQDLIRKEHEMLMRVF